MSQQVNLRLPDADIAAIDAIRGDMTRTAWIMRACRNELAGARQDAPQAAVAPARAKARPPVPDIPKRTRVRWVKGGPVWEAE